MAAPDRLSIRDLAKIAGVSRTTVSLALRGSSEISEKTRKRIQTLAKKHDYRSHPAVNALMQQVGRRRRVHDEEIIAFVRSGELPGENAPGPLEILDGARAEAHRLGYRIEVFWAGPGGAHAEKLARVLYSRGIRGVLWGPMPYPHPPLVFPWHLFVPIACTTSSDVANLPVVRIDHPKGMALILEELNRLGAARIGMVQSAEEDARQDFGWRMGTDLYRYRGGRARVEMLAVDGVLEERALRAWIRRNRLDALVTSHGRFHETAYLQDSLARASWFVPETEVGRMGGLNQGMTQIGVQAVRSLGMRLGNGLLGLPEHPLSILTQASFVDGASLDPLRARNSVS